MRPTAIRVTVMTLLLFCLTTVWAERQEALNAGQDAAPVRADSSNFVRASLLVASPSNVIYSIFGHCALRMECPSEGLDFCFTQETDVTAASFLRFFAGQAKTKVVAVETKDFLRPYQEEGRGLRQYPLNLSHHEKQRLWQRLDEKMETGEGKAFNFITTNCVSMILYMLQSCTIDEYVDFGEWVWPMTMNNGDLLRWYCKNSPWGEFLFMTLFGAESDKTYEQEQRVSPINMMDVMRRTTIVDQQGRKRPILIGEEEVILPVVIQESSSAITPMMVFALLLVVVVIISIGQYWWSWECAARTTDTVLLTLQTVIGLFLLATTAMAGLFGAQWNWYLIPFNPLPLLLWLCFRKRPNFYKIYLFYAVILVTFILATPLLSQVDLSHQLITATLAARCFTKYHSNEKD